MYRPSSPIFDVPEFPTLRRVKPLPKRRRTSDLPPLDNYENIAPSVGTLVQDAAAEELMANADPLSAAQMVLQSYYMPILGGMSDLFKNEQDSQASTPVDLSAGYGLGGQRGGTNDEDGGDGDYIDHLQQPGNTKKRKVPANISGAVHGHDTGSTSGGEDEVSDRAILTGRTDSEYEAASAQRASQASGGSGQRRGKLSRATLAGLQHKEMLKSRKRQLAVVLGALSLGDTLALDQALSTSFPFSQAGIGGDSNYTDNTKVALSRRREARLARAYKVHSASLATDKHSNSPPFPQSDFSFVCNSATSDRLVAIKEEVAALHSRFEAELSRQAARAAEASKQAAAALNNRSHPKRSDRAKQGRTASARSEQTPSSVEQSLLGTPGRGGKKKKRSALANASNPHHLRNYVPSRLPHTGLNAAQALASTQNLINALPVRFLAADIPPRRRSKDRNLTPVSNLANPVDEWICPLCDYELFYGDERAFRRALRNRKKILRRRRRARERAAAAASGTAQATAKSNSNAADDDFHAGFETPHEEVIAAMDKQARVREERERGSGIAQNALG